MQTPSKLIIALLTASLLSGCSSTIDKLENVGKAPPHTPADDPTRAPDYAPISWPLPNQSPREVGYANSLWQPGSRSFFRDQRAARVGDILRVTINIQDKAEVDNETDRSRDSSEGLQVPLVAGLENRLFRALPGRADPANLLDISGNSDSKGTGSVRRQEKIETQVAALITQVLPNGNFVISGKQEVRVNYDIREVSVQGVVRPQDIGSDNTVDSTQIAEARITYGGRGQLMDMQQPRWGTQVLDAVMPF